jgi:hypothetical protein
MSYDVVALYVAFVGLFEFFLERFDRIARLFAFA